ncbi:MAG TPA: amidohydrolase family protein [Acidimicrobiales bacterium]|nr:amidohydrolase family protein [Acidimicrobiales bacterium]
MLDCVIRSATVVDGTGGRPRTADVGVADGRIVDVGRVEEAGARELDAAGLMVAPGIVDPHTHYDAQLFWDPSASPSNLHGVTTVIGGNCGFTLAPLDAGDADYIRRMMAKVEGMPLDALENGVPWSWSSFGEYLDALDGHLGVNAGFLVGHCALRRKVMGAEGDGRPADEREIAAMVRLLGESIDAGGLGFSSSQSRTHSDGDGNPVSSRHAEPAEMLAFCREVARHEGTSLEYITSGCLDAFSDAEIDLMVQMTVTAGRPLNWNLLTIDARTPEKVEHQLAASTRAEAAGGRIVALTMPTLVPMNMSFRNHCALFLIPGWGDVMSLPVPERAVRLADPGVRRRLDELAHAKEAGVFRRLAGWGNYIIGDTYAPANAGLAGRDVASIAAERGTPPFDTLLDVVVADDLRTVLWPKPSDGDDASWRLRAGVWEDRRALVGGSDAGAHLDRMCGANYPTAFLADCLRGRRLLPVERAVHLMTQAPAELFGLRDRGVVAPGAAADLFVFDPEAVDTEPARLVDDLPGGSPRLFAGGRGVVRVLVNGVETVVDGQATGAVPGTLLRSGRDTATAAHRPG